ncbi:hypothetical protein N9C66_05430, partial [Akkermansiaceae bacterium]|nr:hypothetical protein [Akkermansiaceae bacterium]MDB4465279.1 hypothetical protein [Akkermansiaceae bacterium]
LSAFMQGTLWEDHFHSVIVQRRLTTTTTAAYIEHNCPRSALAINLLICSSGVIIDDEKT